MHLSDGQSHTKALHKRVAALAALIFLWLSAGASLTHTDACFDGLAAMPAASHGALYSASASMIPELPCAACEWSALQVLCAAVFVLLVTLLLAQMQAVFFSTAAACRRITFASLRAPPISL